LTKRSPFRHFKTDPEIIRLSVMPYIGFPLSLRNVEDLLYERGIDGSYETVRFGGTGLARCLLRQSGASASSLCAPIATGTWTRST
jgi:transposase-like protein